MLSIDHVAEKREGVIPLQRGLYPLMFTLCMQTLISSLSSSPEKSGPLNSLLLRMKPYAKEFYVQVIIYSMIACMTDEFIFLSKQKFQWNSL
jgi:hypothetical protein